MTELYQRGYLHDFTQKHLTAVLRVVETKNDDEILSRSADDLVEELVGIARLEPVVIGAEPVDGGAVEGYVEVPDQLWGGVNRQRILNVHAVYEFGGDEALLHYTPSTSRAFTKIQADVGEGTLTVHSQVAAEGATSDGIKQAYEREISNIRFNAENTLKDLGPYNSGLEQQIRPAVERRKQQVQSRHDLVSALGFPLKKRPDAPAPVPLSRKPIGSQRTAPRTGTRAPFKPEPALTDAQYEAAIKVVQSTLLAMERTPSVASGKDEEELRDQILVQLNGTFEGAATGETFVQKGKTDILLRVEDRHVFVGECKWWSGEKACGEAIDQLLSYLPWRDEKAALILFIDRKDASAVIEKSEQAVKAHPAFKRVGRSTGDADSRRNFVLGAPDDPEREIQLAVLFAVLPAAARGGKQG